MRSLGIKYKEWIVRPGGLKVRVSYCGTRPFSSGSSPSPDLQQLWNGAEQWSWDSLVVVPFGDTSFRAARGAIVTLGAVEIPCKI
jgi:hypothetical protein